MTGAASVSAISYSGQLKLSQHRLAKNKGYISHHYNELQLTYIAFVVFTEMPVQIVVF
jgi:hypothetical protein